MTNDPTQPIVFVPVPVSEPPHKDDFYFCIDIDGDNRYLHYDLYTGRWDNDVEAITHWLRPTPLSQLFKDKEDEIRDLKNYYEDKAERLIKLGYVKDESIKELEGANDLMGKECMSKDGEIENLLAKNVSLEADNERLKKLVEYLDNNSDFDSPLGKYADD